MGSDILVSVVIPTYNAEKFIRDCLEATIRQSYRNIEIIVVDDGSKDSTVDICKAYVEKDLRIKLFTHPNAGASYTRNCGLREASGDYVVFFDADDYPEDDLIERYLKARQQWQDKEIALVISGMYFDNLYNRLVENREMLMESAHGYIRGENYLLGRATASTLAYLTLFNFVTNKMYDLKIIKEHGICYDDDVRIGEDLKFNLDYLEVTDGYFGMINEPLYHYIKRGDSSLSISYHDGDIEDTKTIYRRFIAWEKEQSGATEDNILTIEGIYIFNWVARLTALYEKHHKGQYRAIVMKKLGEELQSKEFRKTLADAHRGNKISKVRYYSLRLGSFKLYFLLRGVYQLLKS